MSSMSCIYRHTGYNSAVQELRKSAGGEVVDYSFLMDRLGAYASPRDKITQLLRRGSLVRVKKGLYIFGEVLSQEPYSHEVLANLIYGPSYISLEYALSYYGLIPEGVTELTCVTPKRDKYFRTPVGRFSYRYLHLKKYAIGIEQHEALEHSPYLIASPEKALVDLLLLRSPTLNGVEEMQEHLTENLRIDPEDLVKLSSLMIRQMRDIIKHPHLLYLAQSIEGLG
jgi:predicted transcriptional regulator of viral defense system